MHRWLAVIALALAGGCEPEEEPLIPPDAAPDAPNIQGPLVESFEVGTCSTAVVGELTYQIAAELNCMMPGQFVVWQPEGPVQFTTAVMPFLAADARADLTAAIASVPPMSMQVTSMFRTVVQQWLLYRWFQNGTCGITAAATPGTSNHESGRAIDVGNYSDWVAALTAHGWAQDVAGDPVHFDHTASADIRGADVKAFQRLWNRNVPDDPIAEDGVYGPDTEARIKRSPANGFGTGPSCWSPRRFDLVGPDIGVVPDVAPTE